LPNLNVTLVDLSRPMLERAAHRIRPVIKGILTMIQADIRDVDLGASTYDLILAGAVFHHLRSDKEWQAVFEKCFAALKPDGSIWITDLIEHATPAVQVLMVERYSQYLTGLNGPDYRDHVFEYIEQEDTPRSLVFQLDLLRQVGFKNVEILHKNCVFASFGAIKN
jgi:tRNA (cmo5U34)-methyltransferase